MGNVEILKNDNIHLCPFSGNLKLFGEILKKKQKKNQQVFSSFYAVRVFSTVKI